MSCIEAGIFTNVKDDDFVSFNVRLGEPEEEARKMRGTHWKTHIIDLGDKAFLVHATCVEHPELDSLEVFKEGDVMHVDSPFFGGKAKVTYVTTGPNRYLTTAETEDIGTLEITEIYSEEGMKAITVHKDTGATLEEFYTRRLKEEGWFRTTTQEEDLAEFFSLTGAKKNFTGEYKLKAEKIVGRSDGIALTEVLNGFENRNEFTFDTEMERVLSFGKGQDPIKMSGICTKTGYGKYRFAFKRKNDGNTEEWNLTFTQNGAIWMGLDHKTGQSCKIGLEHYVKMSGTFRPISQSGQMDKFAQIIGLETVDDVEKRLTIEEAAGGYFHMKNEGSLINRAVFKLGEEFTSNGFSSIAKAQENNLTIVCKNGKIVVELNFLLTDHFLILTSNIELLNIGTKCIMERVG